jgi:hypothetical protein
MYSIARPTARTYDSRVKFDRSGAGRGDHSTVCPSPATSREPTRRGPYCGAIGYLSADGHVEFNVAIRTMLVKDGLVHIPVGGGIVADSDPADEYEETLVKARAMFAALGLSADDVRRA